MDVKTGAYLVGLVLGSIAILSVCWVWIRSQHLGSGGITLCLVGFLLVGLSVWSSVKLKVSKEGFELDALRKEVQEVKAQNVEVRKTLDIVTKANLAYSRELKVVAQNLEASKAQLVQLTGALAQRDVLTPNQLHSIKGHLLEAPHIDSGRIEAISLDLERQLKGNKADHR